MAMFNLFRSKKQGKAIINDAIQERNSALDDIYNMQNNKPAAPILKKKGKK